MVHQDGFQIFQAFTFGQLCVHHYAELIPTGEGFDVLVSIVLLDDSVKYILRHIAEELTEDVTALVHFAIRPKSQHEIKFQNHRGIFSCIKKFIFNDLY